MGSRTSVNLSRIHYGHYGSCYLRSYLHKSKAGTAVQISHDFCNLTMIGNDVRRPKLRWTGIVNSGLGVTFKRIYFYHERQTKRSFVEKVDFISVAGNLDGVDGRKKAGIKTQGPKLCVTNLAVMDFDEQSGRMRVRSIHEGISLGKVIQNTGFELIVPKGSQRQSLLLTRS